MVAAKSLNDQPTDEPTASGVVLTKSKCEWIVFIEHTAIMIEIETEKKWSKSLKIDFKTQSKTIRYKNEQKLVEIKQLKSARSTAQWLLFS